MLYLFLVLRKDIINGPYHIFGQHTSCKTYFCRGPQECETNLVPEIFKRGLMNEISTILRRVIDNTRSLLFDVDSN